MQLYRISILFIAVAVVLFYFVYFVRLFQYENHEEYKKTSGVIAEIKIESYVGRRGEEYYERAIYLSNGTRFFNRSPNINDLIHKYKGLFHNENVDIFHLEKAEENGGYKVAHLLKGGKVIVDLKDQIGEQNDKKHFLKIMAICFLGIGLAIGSYAYFDNQPKEN